MFELTVFWLRPLRKGMCDLLIGSARVMPAIGRPARTRHVTLSWVLTGRRNGETFFARSTTATVPAFSRWIRRMRANVFAMSVFALDVYLNDGSRIDFTAGSFA